MVFTQIIIRIVFGFFLTKRAFISESPFFILVILKVPQELFPDTFDS